MRVRIKHHRLVEELSKSRRSLNGWAQHLGLSSGHLSDLANGKRPYPTPKTRDKLLDGLDLPFGDLFEIEPLERTNTKKRPNRGTGPQTRGFRDASRDVPRFISRPRGGDLFSLIRDFRFALRALFRSPSFAVAAVLTLTVGVGSNVALFGLVDAILWKPYPYTDSARLVVVHSTLERRGNARSNLSFPDVRDIREQSDLLQGLAAWDWEPYALATGGEAQRVGGTRVSASFFDVLAVPPLEGRTFAPEDDRPGAEPVVILSEGLWERTFARDPEVIGTSVNINARPTTIIGVMPEAAEYPDQTELWVPLAFDETIAPRGNNFLGTVGRLKDGVELASLNTELRSIADRVRAEYPDMYKGRSLGVISLREALSGDMALLSVALLGVVSFVLLIVCANVANLLLSRGVSRETETAIRRAVGASHANLAQGLLAESLLLAAVGAIGGVGIGALAIDQIPRLIAVEIPPWIQVELDHRALLYTVAVTAAATALFSLFPVLQSLRQNVAARLGDGRGHGISTGGRRLRGALVIAEVALSLVLLVGAALMLQNVLSLSAVKTGFEPQGALRVGLDLLAHGDKEPEERALLFERYLEGLEALPGVESVGAINTFPLMRRSNSSRISAEGQTPEEVESNLEPQVAAVTSEYFRAMGIPLLRGDTVRGTRDEAGLREAIVSQRLADTLWPGEDPIGRRIKFGSPDSENAWLTVRGLVGDIAHQGLDRERPAHLYVSYHRRAPTRMSIVLRTQDGSSPEALAPSIRAAVRNIDPNQPVHEIATLASVVDLSMWQWRFFGSLFWWFGGIALTLALVGIYGVMSYSVNQRQREVGLRMALGARQQDVVEMVLRQGGRLVITGVLCGLPLAAALGAVLASALYDVQAFEPAVVAAVSVSLIAVSLIAVLVPARRASRVDPATSLRVG